MIDGRLNFDTKIDTKGFVKGVNNLSSQLGNLKSMLAKLGAAVGIAFSGKEALEAAANINAANSQVEQTFGSLQSAAESAMKKVADSSGILQTRLQNTGTSIYAFAKTTGMDSVSALNMMEEALQVTADSAAYYDRSLEDTAESLKSFLKGNFENDAALGLSCTETTRNAAANKLYGKSFTELSEAQKQLTLLQMVKDANALSGAEGQAAREADGWENVIGNLKEAWRQFLGVVGQPILSVAVNVVKSMTSALQKITEAANAAVTAISEVFGIQLMNASSAGSIADSTQSAAENYSDMAQSAEEIQKANENSLASFDKVNKLSDSSSSNSSANGISSSQPDKAAIAADFDTKNVENKMSALSKKLKNTFKMLFKPLQQSWDKCGTTLVKSAKFKWSQIGSVISAVGKSVAEVWSNGSGEKICENLLEIWTDINNVIGNIAENLKNAWTENNLGTNIIQNIADIFADILSHAKNISKKMSEWASKVDFTPLLQGFNDLTQALTPLADDVGKGLEWFFDNVLLPMANWTIEDAIPAFLNTLSDVIDGLRSVWETAAPVIKDKLWDGFLQPLANWAAGASLTILDGLGKAFKSICESVDEKSIAVIIDLAEAITAVYLAAKGKKAIEKFGESLKGLSNIFNGKFTGWDKGITTAAEEGGATFATKFTAAAAAAFVGWSIGSMIRDAIGQENLDDFFFPVFDAAVAVWDAVAGFFTETIPEFFVTLWETVKQTFADCGEFFSGIWQGIKDVFFDVIDWFAELFTNAWNGIKEAWSEVKQWFSDLWQAIKDVFAGIGTWFKEQFTGAWNGIKEAFSGVKTWFSDRWNDIKNVFSDVKGWFKDKFKGAWDGIKSVFSNVGGFFGGIWDDITGGLKGMVNTVIKGLNWMIGGLNKISFDMPDWIPDWAGGGKTFGINIPEIPYLAKGAVIPPNSEFLAVLGDQKRGTNIEAPLDTIKQAVAEVLAANGSGGMSGSLTIPIYLNTRRGLRLLSTEIIDDINDIISSTGNVPIDL